MASIPIAGVAGEETTLDTSAIDQLGNQLSGNVLREGDAGYDEARKIWNDMIDRRPAVIAQCKSADDVVAAVKFGREHGLLTSIKGAGHNIAGNAVCDGGLMIDLSQMKDVKVDKAQKRAHVGPGATLADFDAATLAEGLATPVGINSTTGIAGLTLGGGFGWLSRKHGMTCDNLTAADVVTADGQLLTVNDNDHPDLFWALKGGGGNFGVVTRFEFQLHPMSKEVLAGLFVFSHDEGKSILEQYREFLNTLGNDSALWVVLRKAPPLPFLPEEVHGTNVVVLAAFHAGDPEEGKKIFEPIRGFGKILGEHFGVMPFTDWQQAFDPLLTPGSRNYWKSHNFTEVKDGLIDAALEYSGNLPSDQTEIFLGNLGGAVNDVAPTATAYAHRDVEIVMNVHGRWEDASQDESCIKWCRDYFKATAPFASGGVYVNFMTEDERERVASAFGPNFDRLAKVKAQYDPDNFFRMNHNIAPKK